METSKAQSGFTLVEISIVLVIIGLLLGGVLKGQSMIENAKAKALVNEFRAVWTMTNSYKDIFKATPGDDALATSHHPAATVSSASVGDEKINTGTWIGNAVPDATNESSLFWQHVRLAGMATGLASSGKASNVVGGPLGITSNDQRPKTPASVIGQYFICSGNLPGRLARAVDIALDDQLSNSGQVFSAKESGAAVTAANAELAASYEDGAFYTVCLAI